MATNSKFYNPCSSLPRTPQPQQLAEASSYCIGVLKRFLNHPVTIYERNTCYGQQNAECTPKRSLFGRRYRCTVEVKLSVFSSFLLGRTHSRYDLSDCVKASGFWEAQLKHAETPRTKSLRKQPVVVHINEVFTAAVEVARNKGVNFKDIDKLNEKMLKENAAAYAIPGRHYLMQDRFVIDENIDTGLSFFAIFAGHNGIFSAYFAAKNLMGTLKNKVVALQRLIADGLSSSNTSQDLSACLTEAGTINYNQLLKDVILSTDESLLAAAKKKKDPSGTSALIAVIEGTQLIVANVGDSRGVMSDSEGNAIQLSSDHKVHQNGGEAITPRGLGSYRLKDKKSLIANPDVRTYDLSQLKGNFLVLASKGVWGHLLNSDVTTFIKGRLDEPHFGAKTLAHFAYLLGSTDNITAMVIKLNSHDRFSTPQMEPQQEAEWRWRRYVGYLEYLRRFPRFENLGTRLGIFTRR